MNTKYFVVLFFILSTATSELLDPLGRTREACLKRIHWTREQLANSKDHPETLGNYLVCVAKASRVLNRRGLIDVNAVVDLVAPVVAPTISRPIFLCCTQEVKESGVKSLPKALILYYKCVVAKVPDVILDLSGLLQEPVYPYLDTCSNDCINGLIPSSHMFSMKEYV